MKRQMAIALIALAATSTSHAESQIANFQSDSIIWTAKLSKGNASRTFWSNVHSPSRMPADGQEGTIAPAIAVGFNICEPNKKTFAPKTLESIGVMPFS